jgi:hypothetical protein
LTLLVFWSGCEGSMQQCRFDTLRLRGSDEFPAVVVGVVAAGVLVSEGDVTIAAVGERCSPSTC